MIQKMGIMGNIFRYLPNSIYGYDIAVKDALSAILRYGTFQSLVVFYDPRQYQEHTILFSSSDTVSLNAIFLISRYSCRYSSSISAHAQELVSITK